jgi:hypothetical protein
MWSRIVEIVCPCPCFSKKETQALLEEVVVEEPCEVLPVSLREVVVEM